MIKVQDYEKATHWIPTDNRSFNYAHVTVGIPYKIFYDGEYYIYDNDGVKSLCFLAFKGDFVLMGWAEAVAILLKSKKHETDMNDKKCCLDLLVNMSLDTGDRDLFMKLTDEYNKMYGE